jgi:hypothetical protein
MAETPTIMITTRVIQPIRDIVLLSINFLQIRGILPGSGVKRYINTEMNRQDYEQSGDVRGSLLILGFFTGEIM